MRRERAPLSVYIQNTDPVSPLLALRMPFLSGVFTDRNQSFAIGEIESSSVDSLPVRGDKRQNARPISIERDLRAASFLDLLPSLSRCDMLLGRPLSVLSTSFPVEDSDSFPAALFFFCDSNLLSDLIGRSRRR